MSLKFFNDNIKDADPEVYETLKKELERQQNQIELIASENIASKAVLNAQGSVMTNKYAEGYPGNRYYGGCEFVDEAENIALERVKELYNCKYANLQPHSGAQANQAVFLALLQPHDTILGMSLASGGHLTHGAKPNLSGKWFNPIQYGVKKDGNDKDLIDYEEVEALALEHKPKLIIAGASAYPRTIDWKKFRDIADKVGAYLLVDMAHYSGLIAGKQYPNPIEHAHIVTSTTHKTLRGPRGGMIMMGKDFENPFGIRLKNGNLKKMSSLLNSGIFPGNQGGPLEHVIAAKAVAFGEALTDDFLHYSVQVKKNAKVMAKAFMDKDYQIISGGTDNHMLLIDLRNKNITGKEAEEALVKADITVNKNMVPFDDKSPFVTSGIRIGTPAITTRGLVETDMKLVVDLVDEVIMNFNDSEKLDAIALKVNELMAGRDLFKA